MKPYRRSIAILLMLIIGCTAAPPMAPPDPVQRATQPKPADFVIALNAGQPQTIVAYGTSLTADGAWVKQLAYILNQRHPHRATVINAGKSSMWSGWGVKQLDTRVLKYKPDAVLIEFAINDAYLPHQTTVPVARANLEQMINRILASNSDTEIILMIMNPPTGIHLEKRPNYQLYAAMYRDVARAQGLRLIDFSDRWLNLIQNQPSAWHQFVPDGIHPNASGAQAIITPNLLKGLGIDD